MNSFKFKLFFTAVFLFSFSQAESSMANSILDGEGTVDFDASDYTTVPIDPENPDEELDIEGPVLSTPGPLRFDYIPTFSFGSQKISDENQEYYADPIKIKNSNEVRANYVQVTDARGNAGGWRVTVRQEDAFRSKTDNKHVLEGAYLSFDNQWAVGTSESYGAPLISKETIKINEFGASYPVAHAKKSQGVGTWAISFGSAHENDQMKQTLVDRPSSEKDLSATYVNTSGKKNSSVRLFVPGKAEKHQEKYSTVLTWTLSEL